MITFAVKGFLRKAGSACRRTAQLAVLSHVQGAEEVLVGGQAVIEGVMMRAPHAFAVAVRRPGGLIATMQDFIQRPSEKYRWLKYPVLRGLGTLGQAIALGIRALRYSADQALEDPKAAPGEKRPEFSNWMLVLNLLFSLGFFIFLYKFVPLYLATQVETHYPGASNFLIFNFIDGTIRIALFLAFLVLLAQWRDIQRLFEYHGAEHKAVWAFEKTGATDLAAAQACSRFHPRCGTSFLLVVMGIAMVFYMFLPFESFTGRLAGRILLLPVIAGVSYEFVRFAAKTQGRLWRWASLPGLWLQRITTREPDEGQLETALRALATAMEMEKSRGGELVVG